MKKAIKLLAISFVSVGILAACGNDVDDPGVDDPAIDEPGIENPSDPDGLDNDVDGDISEDTEDEL